MIEMAHAVRIGGRAIGTLLQRGDVARFVFDDSYWSDPHRPVLGLWFEDNPRVSPQAALRLPPWFSNLLPEGPLRTWIANDRGVNADRELQLLLQIGADLPGAVEVVAGDGSYDESLIGSAREVEQNQSDSSTWKFSLAGVGLKFSMLKQGDRLTIPARDELGDWIVKFPDAVHPDVPRNEFAAMSLAGLVGIEIPVIELLNRDELPDVPTVMWPNSESVAFAIARFDRAGTSRVHIEDFAQVRGFYPHEKYVGAFETVAALAFRNADHHSLQQVVRRLTFNLLIGNGDAHLKNWSLIYPDGRRATLSPAYDIVSTAGYYLDGPIDDFGLKFGGTRHPSQINRGTFRQLQRILEVAEADVLDIVDETVSRFRAEWKSGFGPNFPGSAESWIDSNLDAISQRLSP